jgi:hypothetical protein
MSQAKQCKPEVKKSKAVPEEAGALTREQYETGDFVSLDQYVVKTPGWLPTGYGQESHTNMFHGCTIFRDAGSKYIHVQNQVSLGVGEMLNELFVNSRELFVEEEYDDDGILVHKPPPLDEVWLSEPERRECRHELDKQRERAARQRIVESKEVKKRLKRSQPSSPDLAESGVDTDGKDSLCEEPQFKSGGDEVVE